MQPRCVVARTRQVLLHVLEGRESPNAIALLALRFGQDIRRLSEVFSSGTITRATVADLVRGASAAHPVQGLLALPVRSFGGEPKWPPAEVRRAKNPPPLAEIVSPPKVVEALSRKVPVRIRSPLPGSIAR